LILEVVMAKKYVWKINEALEGGENTEHSVSLVYSNISGKAIINIDGDEYNIGSRPFSLKGTNQMFRLGEMAAMLEFSKKGAPTVTVEGEKIVGKTEK